MKTPRRFVVPFLATLVTGVAAAGALQDQATAPQAEPPKAPDQAAHEGRIVEGPVNIYSWTPEDTAEQVPAANLNLQKVFEELGPEATQWYQHVITLSNPIFEGRAPGTRGSELAADYVEFWMKQAGLEPAFPEAGADGLTPGTGEWTAYRQYFKLAGGAPRVRKATVQIGATELQQDTDFSVLGNSGSGTVEELPVVFAGYAIGEGEDGYTSFAEDVDLKGKAVLFLRYEPLNEEGRSQWSSRRFSPHSGMQRKLTQLVDRGAAAILMVNPPGAVDGRTRLETAASSRWGRPLPVPFVQLSTKAAEQLLQAGDPEKKSLMDWRVLADKGAVKTVVLGPEAAVTLSTELDSGGTLAKNVGGVLRGRGALAEEWLVVGAHYDHVGFGYFGARPDNAGILHPGADDNASGTSAMLVLAQELSDAYARDGAPADARSILFLGFDAEESGLHGSAWYVAHPSIPGDKLNAMINLDMVGRLRNDELNVGGVGTAEGFMDVLRPAFERSGLTIRADPSGRGPSDHASFYQAGVPVLFMYTGSHGEYHTPADKGFTINPAGAAKVIELTKDIALTLAERNDALVFRSSEQDRTPGRNYGASVRLGIMPGRFEGTDGDRTHGVLVASVSSETSAADAGIRAGDVLLTWNGEELSDAGVMMSKLREHKPGDVVKVTVLREGKELPIEVTLRAAEPRS